MTSIRPYTPNQLLDKVLEIGGQIPRPGKYLIIGVQSLEDAYNLFDDLFYVFDGHRLLQVSSGTTNPGRDALLNFEQYQLRGAAIWKTNQWYSNLFTRGYHKSHRPDGGMRALIQRLPVNYFRDADRDIRADEGGHGYSGIIGLNMHGVDYDPFSNRIIELINNWSLGCQVWNRMGDYRNMINAVWNRNLPVDYALLKEF